jgi:hypothetical protein
MKLESLQPDCLQSQLRTVKVFLDTEFTGLHRNTTLISLGLVSEDDRTFYAEFNDYDRAQIDDWLKDNVIPNLEFANLHAVTPALALNSHAMKANRTAIARALSQWLAQFESIEVWADYPAYDWLLFCDLLGGALSLPEQVAKNPWDVATLLNVAGFDPQISREEFTGLSDLKLHHALDDAKLAKACYQKVAWRDRSER